MWFAIKSVGPQGVETELSATGEITGFGKAQGVKAPQATLRDLTQPSGGVQWGRGKGS